MYEARVHGRGGQGVVTTAELLARAAYDAGRWAQAFPSFGPERTGAPVSAFCRIAPGPVRRHEPVTEPDAVLVLDVTLLPVVDVLAGVPPNGLVLVNSARPPAELGLPTRAITVGATDIARRVLGRPLPNSALLGAFAALSGRVPLRAVTRVLQQRFPGELGEANAAAAREGARAARAQRRELTRA